MGILYVKLIGLTGVMLILRKSVKGFTYKSPQNRWTMGFAAVLQTLFNVE